MLGARNQSLLHKLGYQLAHEMSFDQLCQLVTKAQTQRSLARAVGRAQRIIADGSPKRTKKTKAPKALTLSSLENFFAPDVCAKVRSKNPTLSDFAIIQLLQQKGLL